MVKRHTLIAHQSFPNLPAEVVAASDYDALVEAACNVAFRGPKCDCETCEDAFERLRDLLPHDHPAFGGVATSTPRAE